MRLHSLTSRLIAWVLGATAAISAASFWIGFTENRDLLERDARERAQIAAVGLVNHISGLVRGIERATQTLGAVVRHVRPDPDQTRALLRSLLATDATILGAGIAYAPEAFSGGTDFAAYLYRDGETLRYLDIAAQLPAFRNAPWYKIPALNLKPAWSEPYLDAEISGADVVSYSFPVLDDHDGVPRLLAVVTASLPLGGKQQRINAKAAALGDDLRVVILSREGRLVSAENLAAELGRMPRDPTGIYTLPFPAQVAARGREDLRVVAERMMQGEAGTEVMVGLNRETRQWVHFMPLATTGWSAAVIVDEAERLVPIQREEQRERILFVVTLLVLAIVIVLVARRVTGPLRQLGEGARAIGVDPLGARLPEVAADDEVGDLADALRRMQVDLAAYVEELKTTVDAKQRLEGELAAARQIQMAMLPRLPADGRLVDRCDVAATLVPAKAVGGDLFDLVPLPDGRLMFLVGDVSDKGAAAALFMAKTVTLANLLGRDGVAPAALLGHLNRELCRDNEACMFVTALCGVLDPATGAVTYSNAGHNPPLRFGVDGQAHYVDLPPGGMLGVYEEVEYAEQRLVLASGETLLLYTDGVTEATDTELELFGEARLQALRGGSAVSAQALVRTVLDAVERFAGDMEQADDITVLALRRTAEAAPVRVHETELRGGVEALPAAAAWLEQALDAAGVEADLAAELQLVTEEILANVVHHAFRDAPEATATVRLEVDAGEVRLRFSDPGPPFDPLSEAPEPDLDLPPEERPIGGLGVLLCRRLADRIAYRREAGRNVLDFARRRAPG